MFHIHPVSSQLIIQIQNITPHPFSFSISKRHDLKKFFFKIFRVKIRDLGNNVLFFSNQCLYFFMEFKNGQYNFKKDIDTGEQGELFIRNLLENLGYEFIEKKEDSTYDLKMSYKQKEYTYEIKTDVYPKDTGNLVIEFECRNKPSGINITQADYFVTYFPHLGEIWNIKSDDLRKLIAETKPHVFDRSGDKGSNTKLYRLKKTDVAPYFKVHKII